jgi:hypothetical protein
MFWVRSDGRIALAQPPRRMECGSRKRRILYPTSRFVGLRRGLCAGTSRFGGHSKLLLSEAVRHNTVTRSVSKISESSTFRSTFCWPEIWAIWSILNVLLPVLYFTRYPSEPNFELGAKASLQVRSSCCAVDQSLRARAREHIAACFIEG